MDSVIYNVVKHESEVGKNFAAKKMTPHKKVGELITRIQGNHIDTFATA